MNFIFIIFYTSMLLFSYKVFSADLCKPSTFTETTLLSDNVSRLDPFGYACGSGCPNGYKEISVMAIAESFTEGGLTNERALNEIDYRSGELGDNHKTFFFKGALSMRRKILSLNAQCYKIKNFVVASHGSDGSICSIYGKDGVGITVQDVSKLNGLSCAFSNNAEITLLGCNIGHDLMGEDFVEEFGKRLLFLGGGNVTAANNYTSTLPFPFFDGKPKFSDRFSIDGRYREVKFGEGGNIVQSNMNRTGIIERLDLISRDTKELLKIYKGTENDEIRVMAEDAIAELQSARSILLNSYRERTEIVEYKDSSNELVLAEISRGNGIDNLDADERLKLSRSMYIGLQLFDEVSGMYKREQNSKKSGIGDHPLDSF